MIHTPSMAASGVSLGATLWLCAFSVISHQMVVKADILVYTSSQLLIEEFRDMPANFGPRLNSSGLQVFGVPGEPIEGCDKLNPAPNGTLAKYAVILSRLVCMNQFVVGFE